MSTRPRAAIALGVACICLVFLMETWIAHQRQPSAASPYVWGGLGAAAVVALACWAWWRRRGDDADGP